MIQHRPPRIKRLGQLHVYLVHREHELICVEPALQFHGECLCELPDFAVLVVSVYAHYFAWQVDAYSALRRCAEVFEPVACVDVGGAGVRADGEAAGRLWASWLRYWRLSFCHLLIVQVREGIGRMNAL